MSSLPPRIDLLPEHLIDQIKAGEVIDRPGNLLKEILENAVDAGATKLELTIKNNGLDLISLKDNGHGMRHSDLPLAFSRHATSKIGRFEDLYHLRSYGFRGEALASISAISKVQCLSNTADSAEGSELRIEGGMTVFHGERQKGFPHGTELVIQDLFFNTPARLKFIQSQQAEKSFIRRVIYAFVLTHPQIEFQIKLEDAEKEIYPKVSSIAERITSIVPKSEGKILFSQRDYENTRLEVHLIPGNIRTPIKWQNTYINDRYILDKQFHRILSNALMAGFGTDDFQYIVRFTLPPDNIDVNVHPSKTIIKCLDQSKMISLLTSTVKEMAQQQRPASSAALSPRHEEGPDLFAYAEQQIAAPSLSEGGQAYNMEGHFSPHQLPAAREDFIWLSRHFLMQLEGRWIAVYAPRLLRLFVESKLTQSSQSVPLLVSEPYSSRGVDPEIITRLNQSGLELESLGQDTIVLRSIPFWMNGFPLRDVVHCLLQKQDMEEVEINPDEWSQSTWEEMLNEFPRDVLERENALSDLNALLHQRLR